MSDWNGLLLGGLLKSIGTVTFIPLYDLTDEDWDWLDFKNLRPEAKNRITELIVTGELEGFFDVRIEEKARAKKRYLWPGDRRMRQRFEEEDEPQHDFFRYEKADGLESNAAFDYDEARDLLGFKPPSALRTLLRYAIVTTVVTEEKKEEYERIIKRIGDIRNADLSLFLTLTTLWKLYWKTRQADQPSDITSFFEFLEKMSTGAGIDTDSLL